MSSNLFKKCTVTVMAMLAFSSFSFAAQDVDNAAFDKIAEKMGALQIQVTSVKPFVVDGLYEVLTDRGVYYVSKNGRFLIHGNIYDLDNEMENISEKSLVTLRKNRLKAFEKEMIVYKAPQEKHVITVFTDTSCGYCQKLHSEMADYHKQGITVRYLAFPRGGIKSATYNNMVSIWCADDQKLAMDNAKKRRAIKSTTCENTVKEQYELGLFFGVNGTPAIILEDGSLKPGYLPAASLIQLLEKK
ncbi:MAG: thiol:disulfide interchange protein DsbC [Psychromonas sp.]|jgi:thiol:disulfide interchange protein DsbC|uniref:bifunctional protein-disulfide isomerase/oxidoreductase DsbC n=1 Tax=Psychromonas sp. TaxID=1884585 RepID=UPI0039E47E28